MSTNYIPFYQAAVGETFRDAITGLLLMKVCGTEADGLGGLVAEDNLKVDNEPVNVVALEDGEIPATINNYTVRRKVKRGMVLHCYPAEAMIMTPTIIRAKTEDELKQELLKKWDSDEPAQVVQA